MNDHNVILETMLCQTLHYEVDRREYFAFSPPFALCIYYVLTLPGLQVFIPIFHSLYHMCTPYLLIVLITFPVLDFHYGYQLPHFAKLCVWRTLQLSKTTIGLEENRSYFIPEEKLLWLCLGHLKIAKNIL
jgi:hypothetical protein